MHLIDSLEFDVALASEELAFQEQERLRAFVRGPALRVIHSVFDEWSPPHEAWRLERLELDLGVVVGNDHDTVWEQRLRDALHEALSRLRQGGAVARDRAATSEPAFPALARATTATAEPTRSAPTQVRAPADLDALLHFLHHGVLPWHVVLAPGQRLADWAGAIALDAAATLAQHLQRSPRRTHMVRRLAQQLPPAALCPLAQALGLPTAWPLASWVAAAAGRTMANPGRHGAGTTASPVLHEDAPGPAGDGAAVVATTPQAALGTLHCRLWESVLRQAVTLADAGTRPQAGRLRRALDVAASAVTGTGPPAVPVGRAGELPNLAHQLRTAAQLTNLARQVAPGHAGAALSVWPQSDDPAALNAAVRDRLRGNPTQLRDWLLDADPQGQRQRWLAASLSPSTWNDLLKSLAPGAAPTLQCLLRRRVFGGAWLRLSRRPWAQTSPTLREALLDTLLNPATARAATDPLLTSVVEQAADRFHTTSETVTAALRSELARKKRELGAANAGLDILAAWLRSPDPHGATPGAAPATALEPHPTVPVSTAATLASARSRQGDEPQPLFETSWLREAAGAAAKHAPDTGAFDAPWHSTAAAPATTFSATQVLGLGPAAAALRPPSADGARPVWQAAAWPAPPQALALALQRHDAAAAWLAWQACEATDPAGVTAMLAALCRQPALRAALATGLPERRQLALVRRVAAAAAPLLRDWCKHRDSPALRRAPPATKAGDLAAGDRGAAFWSAWWGAWAEHADPARPVQITEFADPATSANVATPLRAFAAATQQAAPVGARPPALADTAHGAPPSLSTRSLPTLLQQWQATAGGQPLPPLLRHEWHRACATAGARAWLVAALPPASLQALAAQLAPSASALNAACTGATLWSVWPADPAAAWSHAGWWRLWLARWAAAPAELAFDCGSGLDAWFVHAARASAQALPVYLDGLLQRLQAVPVPEAAAGPSAQAGTAAADDDAARAPSFVRECAQTARARARSRKDSRAESTADSRWNSPDAWLARRPSKGLDRPRAMAADPGSADVRVRADDAVPAPGVTEVATPARWRAPPAPSLPIGEAVTVANAGLVLLAGFTPRLFATLDWLHERRFVDDTTAGRAAHLLQWLVDERTDADEHELVLNRLLCGLPLATPVPRQVWWQAGECDVAQQMLQGVISHWSALGRTSVQGLRESFLQREGRLVREEAGWRLHVAPRAFDMLLDRLPWSYAMLKLPWMPEVLHVDWR